MGKRQLLLVRHGTTDANDKRLMVGRSDPELNEKGRREAEYLAEILRHRPVERLYCSPKIRCRRTAEVVGRGLELTPEVNNNLREIDFGDWENKSFKEIQGKYPEVIDRWVGDFIEFQFPGGDSVQDLHGRVMEFLEKFFTDSQDLTVCITHGGVISAMICRLLNLPPESYLAFQVLPAGFVTLDILGTSGVLVELNNSVAQGEKNG